MRSAQAKRSSPPERRVVREDENGTGVESSFGENWKDFEEF
jgi:hypothetical protein